MIANIAHNNKIYRIDLSKPLDISIPLRSNGQGVNAWYLRPPVIKPHEQDGFIGSIAAGAAVNFNDIHFNPHSHVTHSETVGHIMDGTYSVNQCLKTFFFLTELITLAPEKQGEDLVISKAQLQYALGQRKVEALVIRTLPNTEEKLGREYSNTNPPYLLESAAEYVRQMGVQHLLVDLPSVDREKDGGQLLAHHAFWNSRAGVRKEATITEFIYVPNHIVDGSYFLNLQLAPIENDASPSRPVLYQIV